VQGSGFRVQGSGFRVQGSRFRVQGEDLARAGHARFKGLDRDGCCHERAHALLPRHEGVLI
jgi:hypothetical protein